MKLRWFVFCFLWVLTLPQTQANATKNPDSLYKALFKKGEMLSNTSTPNDKTDALALQSYERAIAILAKTGIDNLFLLKTYIATGTFLQVLNRQHDAIAYFRNAFLLKEKISGINDSVLFKPLVYCGNSYYRLDRPDSAEIFYKKAEVIATQYPHVNEVERLYNTLGVIAYATGNYNLSISYYEKAISIIADYKSYDKTLLITYKNNLASAYRKLKRYEEALKAYQQLLSYHTEEDKLRHNIGAVYLAMGNGKMAIAYLKKVSYNDQRKLNDLGRAYYLDRDYTNAIFYLLESVKLNHGRKNSDFGITEKYLGDVALQQNQVRKALTYYQYAIQNLSLDFNSDNIYVNPDSFNTVFNTGELMDALLAKADAFKLLYKSSKNINDLMQSLQTFRAFYKLADQIEQFYQNDEARLLISDRKYAVHQAPIAICLTLFKLTNSRKYIEQAFYLDEENKANTLSLYLQEARLKAKSSVPKQLINLETTLKEQVTNLTLKAAAETDNIKLNGLKKRINDYALELANVQQKINSAESFKKHNLSSANLSVKAFMETVPSQAAVLSYHVGDSGVLCFIITHNKFDFFYRNTGPQFSETLKQLYRQSQLREGNTNKQVNAMGQTLYSQLVAPAEPMINGKDDLMIIPDDELNYLPFELLVNKNGDKLLTSYSITYNYSCTILQNNAVNYVDAHTSQLGMAPFDNQLPPSNTSTNEWVQLPASKTEMQSLKGEVLLGNAATKQKFLLTASNFNIIHLATHAYANDHNPNQSFIAFYPTHPGSALDYKLYQPEIYNLKLDRTRLIVLSACESGVGELIKGEGLMSLSRAFSYAGCNNIITSMWKADDVSTAYISGRFHHYLQKGFDIATALKKAKIDYLDDDNISPSKKTPGYWAHLRLIGEFNQQTSFPFWLIYLAFAMLLLFILIKKSRSFIKKLPAKLIK